MSKLLLIILIAVFGLSALGQASIGCGAPFHSKEIFSIDKDPPEASHADFESNLYAALIYFSYSLEDRSAQSAAQLKIRLSPLAPHPLQLYERYLV